MFIFLLVLKSLTLLGSAASLVALPVAYFKYPKARAIALALFAVSANLTAETSVEFYHVYQAMTERPQMQIERMS